ncbi:MAG: hypothetical protein Fur0015_00430 [Ignavibacteriales bacterium]
MIKNYFIDGNNVIGKSSQLKRLQKNNPQESREKFLLHVEKYFYQKKVSVNLYFDGFMKSALASSKIKIIYSDRKTADELIREDISKAKNPRTICLVSSDLELIDFARKNSCKIIKSEEFLSDSDKKISDAEKENFEQIISKTEMLRLFGVKE